MWLEQAVEHGQKKVAKGKMVTKPGPYGGVSNS